MTKPALLIAARGTEALVACAYEQRVAVTTYTLGQTRDARLLQAVHRVVSRERMSLLRLIVVGVQVQSFSQTRVFLTCANALSAALGCPVVQVPVTEPVLDARVLLQAGAMAARKPHPRWAALAYSGAPNITPPSRGDKLHVSAGGLVFDQQRKAILVVQRKDNLRMGTPKGHREGDEKLVETAKREIREETGLVDLQLMARLPAVRYHANDHGKLPKAIPHILHHFLFLRIGTRVVPRVMSGEVKNLRLVWLPVPVAKMPAHLHADLKVVVQQAVKILQAKGLVRASHSAQH